MTESRKRANEKWIAENPEKYRAAKQAWAERNRERMRASRYGWQEANREKVLAHSAVTRALKRGELTRLPCEVCGDSSTHAHHDDYALRLVVRWLCALHHKALHRRFA